MGVRSRLRTLPLTLSHSPSSRNALLFGQFLAHHSLYIPTPEYSGPRAVVRYTTIYLVSIEYNQKPLTQSPGTLPVEFSDLQSDFQPLSRVKAHRLDEVSAVGNSDRAPSDTAYAQLGKLALID
eukprot:IDg2106t1